MPNQRPSVLSIKQTFSVLFVHSFCSLSCLILTKFFRQASAYLKIGERILYLCQQIQRQFLELLFVLL